MARWVMAGALCCGLGCLAACQTVKGMGKDVQNAGEVGERAINGSSR
jgi:predicted small secreted protein